MAKQRRSEDDFNNEHHVFSLPVMITTAVVSGVILMILLAVLATNKTGSGKNNLKNTQMLNEMLSSDDQATVSNDDYDYTGKDIDTLYNDHKLRAEDLDIWDMYNNDNNNVRPIPEEAPDKTPGPEPSPSPEQSPAHSPGSLLDGYELIDEIPKNTVDYKDLKIVDDKMSYMVNGQKASQLGVMISADSGTIDFNTLKSNGIGFVMIKAGSRGYDSGIINEDVNFEQNIKGATDAGMNIGLYFCSRAITVREAIEEADFCASKAYDYKITYPIAYVFEGNLFDNSRTDSLSEKELTEIADTFLYQVRLDGYTPILYGTGDFLLNGIDEKTLLLQYDVFLSDDKLDTEFPYRFKMWRYTSDKNVKGMSKPGDLVMSLVDYSGR